MNKAQYIDIMEYYLALSRNEILTHAITRVNSEDKKLSEISSHKIQILNDSIYTRNRVIKIQRQKVEWLLPGTEGRKKVGGSNAAEQ